VSALLISNYNNEYFVIDLSGVSGQNNCLDSALTFTLKRPLFAEVVSVKVA